MKPADRKLWARRFNRARGLSERKAWETAGISGTVYRSPPSRTRTRLSKIRLKELAELRPSYGHPMLHSPLKREGLAVNKKRTYRLYYGDGSSVEAKGAQKAPSPQVGDGHPGGSQPPLVDGLPASAVLRQVPQDT